MNPDDIEFNAPVLLADKKMGMVTKIWPDAALVQVPGEELERQIDFANLEDAGGGALRERIFDGDARIPE